MKLTKLALVAALACGSFAGNAFADQANDIQLVSCCEEASCDCGEPACGCESPSCGCDMGCDGGCDSCCDSGCGLGLDCLTGDCCLGDPYTLFDDYCGWSFGGWASLGYHSKALPIFNDRPDELNLHQAWLYAEKAIDTSCGFDIGGRIDYLYGIDAQNTQAFGKDNGHWDNQWDNGEYGHALPQAYVEAGYGDLSVKVGHFYTIIGYEVVPATGNFFYSHAYTFNNSEPFTHTGALAKYNVSDNVTAWGGYTLGWDSGFEDNGDAFLGGLSLGLTDDLTLTYATSIGRFADSLDGDGLAEQGYMHSIVADYAVTDSLQYIIQSDVLGTEFGGNAAGLDGLDARRTFGINQYLIKTLSDCWSVGGRFEWYNVDNFDPAASLAAAAPVYSEGDVYALTLGVNHKPHANVTIRPEVRFDWDDDGVVGLEDGEDQTTFGIDTIFTF